MYRSDGTRGIRQARGPLEAGRLARETYQAARDPDWGSKKVDVVEEILRAKLAQHSEAREALQKSGHEEIVED